MGREPRSQLIKLRLFSNFLQLIARPFANTNLSLGTAERMRLNILRNVSRGAGFNICYRVEAVPCP